MCDHGRARARSDVVRTRTQRQREKEREGGRETEEESHVQTYTHAVQRQRRLEHFLPRNQCHQPPHLNRHLTSGVGTNFGVGGHGEREPITEVWWRSGQGAEAESSESS